MDGMITAESLTKFLRGREGSLHEITSSAFKLLRGELDVFLPNKRIFLIRLLVDRLNDASQLKEWKYDVTVWKLFITLWYEMDDEAEIRKKETKNLRLIDIMINVICFCRSKDNIELLETHFEFVKLVLRDSFARVEESQALPILASYAHTVSILVSVDDIQETLLDDWTETVKTLYDLSQANSVKFSKKNANVFFDEALPYILKFSERASAKNFFYSKDTLLKCATAFLSNKEKVFALHTSIGLLLDKHHEILSNDTVKLLFNLVLSIPNVNMDICEKIYLCISEKINSDTLSESLLGELSRHNKVISHGFFKKIYETEFIAKKERPNWTLIFEIIKMDPELALEILFDIMPKLEVADRNTALKLGDAIADSYLRCREYQGFYVDVLSKAGDNSVWSSSEYVDLLSKKITFLRPAQVIALLKAILQRGNCLYLIKSIIKGLLYCSVTTRNMVWHYISENREILRPIDLDWELIYYLLCLYGKQLLESKRDYLHWVLSNKVASSKYYFYCVFRINEILRDEMPDSRYNEDFVEFLKQIDPTEGSIVSIDLLLRWPIILENGFSKFQKREISALILEYADSKQMINYFENDSEVFFEQENLTTIFLKLLEEKISIVDELKKETSLRIFSAVPIQSVSKVLKVDLLDKFGELATTAKYATIKYLSRAILLSFLALPSFSSRIENDPKKQLELLYTSDIGSRAVSVEILRVVLKNAINQHKSEQNRKYLLNLTHILIEEIRTDKMTSNTKIASAIELSLLFLTAQKRGDLTSEYSDGLLTLEKVTTASVLSYLNDLLSRQEDLEPITLNKYLQFLLILLTPKEKDRAKCLTVVKNIGAQVDTYDNLKNEDTLLLLFGLMAKFSEANFRNAIYLSALFFALQQKYLLKTRQLDKSLYHYFVRLSDLPDEYTKVGLYILSSIIDLPSSNGVASILNIVSCFLTSFNKKIKDKCIILSTKLFSSILDKFKFVQIGGYDSLLCLTEMLKYFVTNMQWCCKQYNVELILLISTDLVRAIDVSFPVSLQINLYVQVSQCLSSIILFQRFRLSSRYHVVNHIFVTMLKPLSNKGNALSTSEEAAAAYSRLLSNLCEPPNTTLMNQHEKLSSSSSLIRKPLRNHIPVLLANFIYYNLNFNFRSEVHDILIEGIFRIFDVLSQREINYVNDILDNQGKAYYKTLYKKYKDFGKWNSQETL